MENTCLCNQYTFNCCCSSLLSRANTVFVSLFLLIDAWIAFLSFPTDLRTHKHTHICLQRVDKQNQLLKINNKPLLPRDGRLSCHDSGYNVWFLRAGLLVLRPQLVLRLQPPAHRFRRRSYRTRRALGLNRKQIQKKGRKTLIWLS